VGLGLRSKTAHPVHILVHYLERCIPLASIL
jgi:hypothetical protein